MALRLQSPAVRYACAKAGRNMFSAADEHICGERCDRLSSVLLLYTIVPDRPDCHRGRFELSPSQHLESVCSRYRTEELALTGGEARFQAEITTKHTLYLTNNKYLPKTVTIVIEVCVDNGDYERVATLYVDLGTMCNSSSQGWVEAEAQASALGRQPQVYKIEVPHLLCQILHLLIMPRRQM